MLMFLLLLAPPLLPASLLLLAFPLCLAILLLLLSIFLLAPSFAAASVLADVLSNLWVPNSYLIWCPYLL
jgi:hypothetical protein